MSILPATARVLACTSLLLALLPPAAAVTSVPNATVLGTVLFNRGDRIDTVAFGHFEVDAAPFGGLELDAQGQPFSLVSANGLITTDANTAFHFGSSGANLRFYIGINGPASLAVPVLIDVAGFASGLAGAGASFAVNSEWTFSRMSPNPAVLATDTVLSGSMSGSFSQGFSRTVALTLDTNSIYEVFMRAAISVAATDPNSASQGSAFIDPLFRFDTGVDTSQYSFVFSPGIGNQVPEPQAAVLMALGLALLATRRLRAL